MVSFKCLAGVGVLQGLTWDMGAGTAYQGCTSSVVFFVSSSLDSTLGSLVLKNSEALTRLSSQGLELFVDLTSFS